MLDILSNLNFCSVRSRTNLHCKVCGANEPLSPNVCIFNFVIFKYFSNNRNIKQTYNFYISVYASVTFSTALHIHLLPLYFIRLSALITRIVFFFAIPILHHNALFLFHPIRALHFIYAVYTLKWQKLDFCIFF